MSTKEGQQIYLILQRLNLFPHPQTNIREILSNILSVKDFILVSNVWGP